jgi:hypothetical protein
MASEGKKRKLDVDDDTKNAHYTPVMPDRDNFNRTEYYSPTWESSHWERFQPKEAINGSKVIEFELRSLFKKFSFTTCLLSSWAPPSS